MGEAAVVDAVTKALTVIGGGVSAFLAIGIAIAFIEGQIASMTGAAVVKADIMRRISLLVVCVAIVAYANIIVPDLTDIMMMATDTVGFRQAWLRLGAYAVDVLIGASVVLMAIGVGMGFVDAQLHTVFGQPDGLSLAFERLIAIAALSAGAILTITISQMIVNSIVAGG